MNVVQYHLTELRAATVKHSPDPRHQAISLTKIEELEAWLTWCGTKQNSGKMGEESQEGWEAGRWWRVLGPDGKLWNETSSEEEARESMRPGDRLQRLWLAEKREWRDNG